jgi:hypothetical protein
MATESNKFISFFPFLAGPLQAGFPRIDFAIGSVPAPIPGLKIATGVRHAQEGSGGGCD